mgnify:CR=1 FL=1
MGYEKARSCSLRKDSKMKTSARITVDSNSGTLRVSQWLKGKKLIPFVSPPGTPWANLIGFHGRVKKTFLGIPIPWKVKRYLGFLELESATQWVLHIYGRKHLAGFEALAEEMVTAFGVPKIHIKLRDEEDQSSSYLRAD